MGTEGKVMGKSNVGSTCWFCEVTVIEWAFGETCVIGPIAARVDESSNE